METARCPNRRRGRRGERVTEKVGRVHRLIPGPQSRPPFARFAWQSISPHDGHAAPAGDFLVVRDQRELVLQSGGANEPVGGIFVRPIQLDGAPSDAWRERQNPEPVTEVFEPRGWIG